MTKFQQIAELWAQSHIDFSHNPSAKAPAKEKAFYVIDTVNEQNEFVRNFNTAHSPCIAVSSLVDAQLKDNRAHYTQTVYFLMKSKGSTSKTQKQDDAQNASIKEQLNEYVLEFLAWLTDYKKKHESDKAVRGIVLDGAEWASIPMKYNGWWLLALEMTQTRGLSTCLVASHYKEVSENENEDED